MRKKDTLDVVMSSIAVAADAAAAFVGLIVATWIRFDSGLVAIRFGRPDPLYFSYSIASCFGVLVFLIVFKTLGLFIRPQTGSYTTKIPRLVRAVGIGVLLCSVLAFAAKNETVDFSRAVLAISFLTVSFFVVLERYILFRIEWNLARHSSQHNRVLVLGTDEIAAHLQKTFQREPMLRSKVAGFLTIDGVSESPEIPPERILGKIGDFTRIVQAEHIDQVILTSSRPGYEKIMSIIIQCEREMITFNMVPDLFRIITGSMDVQSLDDIPLLGVSRWPLDLFWNRVLKRTEDVVGAVAGLIFFAPIIGICAMLIRRSSPGPVFYRQERCGESGQPFTLYKLRTMRADAENETGPVFASENDPRRTPIGAFLRRFNIDELPQLWNVLKGDMSLVGPRPERPHFVEQFREEISRYMWRHVSKPGMTGWAQVNGLRGNTSIEERIKYDLYYLENWSLAFDFKILIRTVVASQNAY